jgi:hypothetical protein
MMHKRLLIGSGFVLLALIFGLTLEQKFSERADTVLAAESDTTTPALPPTSSCQFSGTQITALILTQTLVDDKVEVGWNFTMPQELASLGVCATLDHFDVFVTVSYANESIPKKETAGPLVRNAVVRFSSVAKKARHVEVLVVANYKITANSNGALGKDF